MKFFHLLFILFILKAECLLNDTLNERTTNFNNDSLTFNEKINFPQRTEFDLLVNAEQTSNSKNEFLSELVNGKVGQSTSVEGITDFVEGEKDYVEKYFISNSDSNYLYYDFVRKPVGNVASLRIKTNYSKIIKIGCVFVESAAGEEEMINLVNKAVLEGSSVCVEGIERNGGEINALIKVNILGTPRLVVKVLYEPNEIMDENSEVVKIVLKITGTELDVEKEKFENKEEYSLIPYVLDLIDIRDSSQNYISKILLYSNTRELEMYYLDDSSPAPILLFKGNILLIYTNEELIRQKYHGATTMILITDCLSDIGNVIIGEEFRFMKKNFNSETNIQYFLSSNPDGRPLNNPTTIEMTSCSQPYYYIMNYNKAEGLRKLHIDTIFGEKDTIKIAKSLYYSELDDLISNMEAFVGDEIILESQNYYHFDVMEITCKLPLLLNIFYVDPTNTKVNDLEIGDISIFSLGAMKEQELTFKNGTADKFFYTFNILKENYQTPNIEIIYNGEDILEINENGVYPVYSEIEYTKIIIKNKDITGNIKTRIIFKYGYDIEYNFEKIQNEIYSNQNDNNREINLFGYIYDTTSSKLNYTGVDFEVSTIEDNVQFCYSTNLGIFINPSLQNCYRVGRANPYTISTLNPLVMYKNYFSHETWKYYVSFRTVNLDQNITITPILKKYDTNERNLEREKNTIIIPEQGIYSTILSAPKNNNPYLFTHIHVCTKDQILEYQFLNAYNLNNLGKNGEIPANSKNNFIIVNNTKLDTKLVLKSENGVEVFVKHVGISYPDVPIIHDIVINYQNETRTLIWTSPKENEEFQYIIYIDNLNTLSGLQYTLCSFVNETNLTHNTQKLTTDSNNPSIKIPDEYDTFEILIFAEQTSNFGITTLSEVYQFDPQKEEEEEQESQSEENEEEYKEKEEEKEEEKKEEKEEEKKEEEENNDEEKNNHKNNDNVLLIVIISIVVFLVIAGVIIGIYLFRKNKKKKYGEIIDRLSKEEDNNSMKLLEDK